MAFGTSVSALQWYQLGSRLGQIRRVEPPRDLQTREPCEVESGGSRPDARAKSCSILMRILHPRIRIDSMADNNYLKDLILLRNDPSKVARVREAAERGEMDAQYAMGLIYAEGRGVEIDLARAHFWLSLAIAQGDTDADLLRNIIGSQMTDAEFDAAKELAVAHRATHPAPASQH